MLASCAMLTLNILKRSQINGIRFSKQLKHCEDSCFIIDFTQLSRPKALLTIPNDDYRYRRRMSSASHSMNCSDVTLSLKGLLDRWRRERGRWGGFTQAVDRYYFRCIHAGRLMTAPEASMCRCFLLKAMWFGFFWPWKIPGRSRRGRWLFFFLLGNPRILTEKAGWLWLVRKKAKEMVP